MEFVLRFGSSFHDVKDNCSDRFDDEPETYIQTPDVNKQIDLGIKTLREHGTGLKLTDEQIMAWMNLCAEKEEAFEYLDAARPLPKVTAIRLSPKVTFALKECNLDLELTSIKPAKIDFEMIPAVKFCKTEKTITPVFKEDGTRSLMRRYFVSWTKGVVHGQSYFTRGCHACGKNIPSGRYVPVEAKDKRSGKLISMWLGCDCAANIFGIKDVGISREEEKV